MKFKSLLLTLIMICSMMVVGCGTNSESEVDGENSTTDLTQTEVNVDGIVVSIGDSMDSIRDTLGEIVDYSESKSCLYNGYDKIYTYEDVVIITYPMEDGEYIASITVSSKDVELGCGVSIGDTTEDIKASLGETNLIITQTCYMFEKDDFGIACYLEGDVVTEVEIYSIAE